MTHAEVLVVGGGPAGSATAIRLAQLGVRVALAEAARFPREHVGEALAPSVWPLLEVLGIDRERAGARAGPRATVRWASGTPEQRATPGSVTVDRAAFDAV